MTLFEPPKDAQCITAPSSEIAGMFDFRLYTEGAPENTAFVWGFSGECDYGPGCYNPVAGGTSQWNACLGEPYPATWDSDEREFDPLTAEVKLDKGGNGVVAFYFLSESNQCRSQKWTLSIADHTLNGNAELTGTILDLSVGKYLVFDFSAGSGLPEGGVTLSLVSENLPEDGTNCASYRELGPNSHISGIFINDTLACADDPIGCRFTGGLKDKFDTGNGKNSYRAGGQVGANTGQQPQPKGEWTHRQRKGPAGKFTFHGGTASAPRGSEIDVIRCSDPGGCKPSGDPPSPVKQLDFDGIGNFKNIGKKGGSIPDFMSTANVSVGHGNKNFDGTLHWFEVNIDDLGEPGNTNPKKNPGDGTEACPANGFGEKGDDELGDCSCSDFYRITIYDGVDAATVPRNEDGSIDKADMNTSDVIYEVWGYIDGGNLQLHHPTGFDLK